MANVLSFPDGSGINAAGQITRSSSSSTTTGGGGGGGGSSRTTAAGAGYDQVKLDNKGTYGAQNTATGKVIAFDTQAAFNQYFSSFDPNAQMAKFDTSSILNNPNQVLNLNQVKTTEPYKIGDTMPAPAGPQYSEPDAVVTEAQQWQKDLAKFTPPEGTETPTQKKKREMDEDLSDYYEQLRGKKQAVANEEAALGVPQNQKEIAATNAEILGLTAAYDQAYKLAEGQAIPMSIVIGQQAQIKNQKALEIGRLQAKVLGLQGMVAQAIEQAKKNIDLQFAPIEEGIYIKEKQREVISSNLDRDEKRELATLQYRADIEKEALKELKDKMKANMETILNNNVTTQFANQNGEFMDKNGNPYSTPEAFFKAAGVKSFEEAYARGLVTDVKATVDVSQYPTSYQEYLLAKQEGFAGDYNAYQTMDSNRKRSNTTIINEGTKEFDLQVKQAPAQVATLKAQGRNWGEVAAYFTALGIDPGSEAIDDAMHRAFSTQEEYNAWKALQ